MPKLGKGFSAGDGNSTTGRLVHPDEARADLAKMIIRWSLVLILIFGIGTIGIAIWLRPPAKENSAIDVALGILNSLLPILSAWVGAVLAYYFVNKATEEANRTTLAAIRRRNFSDAVRAQPITRAMRNFDEIDCLELSILGETQKISTQMGALVELLSRRTRAPLFVWDAKKRQFVLRYVLHQSTVYEFLYRTRPDDLKKITIQDLLDDPSTRMRWDMTLAHPSQRSTLADAKAAMDANPRIQDVVVTLDGNPGSAFVGWLTNVDVLRHCVAGASSLDDEDSGR